MLPTFLFIFGVYAILALLKAWRQRAMRLLWSPKRKPNPRWGAPLMLFGLALLAVCAAANVPPYHSNLVEVLDLKERDVLEGQVLSYPMSVHATEVPPMYSLLHPQMTTPPFLPEKKTSVFFLRKPQQKVQLRMSNKKVKISYSLAMIRPRSN